MYVVMHECCCSRCCIAKATLHVTCVCALSQAQRPTSVSGGHYSGRFPPHCRLLIVPNYRQTKSSIINHQPAPNFDSFFHRRHTETHTNEHARTHASTHDKHIPNTSENGRRLARERRQGHDDSCPEEPCPYRRRGERSRHRCGPKRRSRSCRRRTWLRRLQRWRCCRRLDALSRNTSNTLKLGEREIVADILFPLFVVIGSMAAAAQAGIGNVVAPSLFAAATSAAAGGYGVAALTGAVQVIGGAAAAVAAAGVALL